jgi:hypothetical protein
MKQRISLALFIFSALFLVKPGYSQDNDTKPEDVYIGTYLNRIYDVSLKDNCFSVDLYIWFRWKSDDIDPIESFEIINGRIDTKTHFYDDIILGYKYATCRVTATITKFWDVSDFPLDNHCIQIEIEDSENESYKFAYIPDTENSAISPDLQVPGWIIKNNFTEVTEHHYRTNYGDISLPTDNASIYSRFTHSIDIVRPNIGYFLKLFFGVFIAALIAFLAFLIKPTDLDPRFGLGIGAIFAAVASEYVITSSLPDTNVMTLADKLHILAFAFIFLSLAQSTLSLWLYTKGREKLSRRLDIGCFFGFIILYSILSLLITLLR